MKEEEAQMAIPHLFRCPISLDLFTDPVTLSTGHTYDRSSIEKWLATGNLTCPVTMQKLQDPSMVPNHTLRHLIDQWVQKGHHFGTDYFTEINTDFSLPAIRYTLESREASLEKKLQILAKIQALTYELPSKNYSLVQLGLFTLLLEQVFGKLQGDQHVQRNLKLIEQELLCVLKLLPFSELGSLNILKEESKITQFSLLFEQGNNSIKKCLCQLVVTISSSFYNKELCISLVERQSFVQGIVLFLHHENSENSEIAIRSISALCCLEPNRENLVKAGAIHGLVTYILGHERREKSLAPKAMATLEVLLRLETAKMEIVHHPNGVNALVKMVFRVSNHEGSDSALNSLMIICYDSLKARENAICAGVLTQLLLLLQSQCGERTKTKARMLLKLLRSMWSEDRKQD